MAENESYSLWGLLDSVKKHSQTIINIYKEDLQEFTATLKDDTTELIKNLGKNATEEGQTPVQDLKADGSSAEDENVVLSRREKRLRALQTQTKNYTDDPSDEEDFKKWCDGFDLSARTEEISQLLASNDTLRALHADLLPSVGYPMFWQRYYYRVEQLNKEDKRRKAILERASKEEQLEDWGWEEEEAQEDADKESEEDARKAADLPNDAAAVADASGPEESSVAARQQTHGEERIRSTTEAAAPAVSDEQTTPTAEPSAEIDVPLLDVLDVDEIDAEIKQRAEQSGEAIDSAAATTPTGTAKTETPTDLEDWDAWE